MRIQLSDHFTTGKLLRFVAPSIVMMIFTSVYGVVDGLFVSNFVGKTAFAAVNLIFPLLMILGALGFMIGTGGSALVARTLGEGDSGRAQRYFSMLVYVTIGGGIVFSVLGLLFLRPIAVLLGAQGAMLEDCVVYGGILLAGQTMFMLQNVFQSFLILSLIHIFFHSSCSLIFRLLKALPKAVASFHRGYCLSTCLRKCIVLHFVYPRCV